MPKKKDEGLAKIDLFGVKPVERLHFARQEVHNSSVGGCCTIILAIAFIFILLVQGYPIYKRFNKTF